MRFLLRKLGKIAIAYQEESQVLFDNLEDGVYKASITKAKIKSEPPEEIRRACQNRLMWLWLHALEKTTINEIAGKTAEEWHEDFKRKYLINIFIRTKPWYAEFYTTMETVLRESGKETYDKLISLVITKTSTTEANVHEFAEYLEKIQAEAHGYGVAFVTDDYLFRMAIGGRI